jgi:hypothetical protein
MSSNVAGTLVRLQWIPLVELTLAPIEFRSRSLARPSTAGTLVLGNGADITRKDSGIFYMALEFWSLENMLLKYAI